MLFKPLFFIFLAIFTGYLLASEAIDENRIPGERSVATQEDLSAIRIFVKSQLGVQGVTLKNIEATLAQLKMQMNALDKSLGAIQSDQTNALNNLHFIHALLSLLCVMQALGLWLLIKNQPTKIESKNITISNDGGTNNPAMNQAKAENMGPIEPTSNNSTIRVEESPAIKVAGSANAVISNRVSISGITVQKAMLLPGIASSKKNELHQKIDSPIVDISVLLTKAAKMRLECLEKVNAPHLQRPQPTKNI